MQLTPSLPALSLLLASLIVVQPAQAEPLRECYQDACAEIELPACNNNGSGTPLRIAGQLANPHRNSITAWQLVADAEWEYNANHQVKLLSGNPIDSNGFQFGSEFERQLLLTGTLPGKLLLAFGPRSGGHGFYDVAVEVTLSPQGEQQVQLDVKPGSCPNPVNRDKKGLTPVAVVGSNDLDVREIDLHSIRIAGVAPVRYSYSDVTTSLPQGEGGYACTTARSDGISDLTLKFNTAELIAALEQERGRVLFDGEIVTLPFRARLKDAGQCSGGLIGEEQIQIINNRR
ncbi:hypothetical protein [Motiliproteus sediminis]|uniref:hypothetical protein n=1 Tax=Motiliproteus sediminis TaxID=1468178 RepID=UPI001AEFEFA7|nr:hypothetical protein [Motiliproteus sediminis]